MSTFQKDKIEDDWIGKENDYVPRYFHLYVHIDFEYNGMINMKYAM